MAWIDDNKISNELFERICDRYASDLSFQIMRDIRDNFGIAYNTLTRNIKYDDNFKERWHETLELRADNMFEYSLREVMDKSDDKITNINEYGLPWITPNSASVQRSGLISKHVLLMCSHLAPWKYDPKALNKVNDKQPIQITGMVVDFNQISNNEQKKID